MRTPPNKQVPNTTGTLPPCSVMLGTPLNNLDTCEGSWLLSSLFCGDKLRISIPSPITRPIVTIVATAYPAIAVPSPTVATKVPAEAAAATAAVDKPEIAAIVAVAIDVKIASPCSLGQITNIG